MRRTVKRWMAMKSSGTLANDEVPHRNRKTLDAALWPGETAVRATITYDDGRKPSRKKRGVRRG